MFNSVSDKADEGSKFTIDFEHLIIFCLLNLLLFLFGGNPRWHFGYLRSWSRCLLYWNMWLKIGSVC